MNTLTSIRRGYPTYTRGTLRVIVIGHINRAERSTWKTFQLVIGCSRPVPAVVIVIRMLTRLLGRMLDRHCLTPIIYSSSDATHAFILIAKRRREACSSNQQYRFGSRVPPQLVQVCRMLSDTGSRRFPEPRQVTSIPANMSRCSSARPRNVRPMEETSCCSSGIGVVAAASLGRMFTP
jgi:hypothetical protein